MGGESSDLSEAYRLQSTLLSSGWLLIDTNNVKEPWIPVKKVPSTVHQDLLDHDLISDPFLGFNELEVANVAEKTWTYHTQLHIPDKGHRSRCVLQFDGLDTFAHVRLDGRTILVSENMFVSHRVDITNTAATNSIHDLEIEFDSALLRARQIKSRYPGHRWICWNGEEARLGVRKAQYHWGWDWGPKLMCAGIYKPIRLESFTARVEHFRITTALSADFATAVILVDAVVEKRAPHPVFAKFSLSLEDEIIDESTSRVGSGGRVHATFNLESPKTWMPVGMGPQTLYKVSLRILYRNIEFDHQSKMIGLRNVQLVEQPDTDGKSFYFHINGVDVFCGGSCWIPADSFLTNMTKDQYRSWLELLVRGNQNMIRVWGGGIYESDDFYDICDELGILVWQDFLFACGNYPCYSAAFIDSIKDEAKQNLRRLRHHPSLVLLVGNNEDYQVAESNDTEYDPADEDPAHWADTDFPARIFYEAILPRMVLKVCPWVAYRPGSPWGDGRKTSDPTVGDVHQWNVWHGTQELYQRYPSMGGRFNSEFGMQALPHIQTIKTFLPHPLKDDPDRSPAELARHLNFHNKADGQARRLATYLADNVRTNTTTLREQIYLTQLIQSEAMTYAYRQWRRDWYDRKCGGALVWQLNDCWPGISWSIVDYYLRPKAAYYAIKRCLAPLAVGVAREHWDWTLGHARIPESLKYEVWGVSRLLEDVEVSVEVRFITIETGEPIRDLYLSFRSEMALNNTMEWQNHRFNTGQYPPFVIAVRMWRDGVLVARDMDWPQPLKYLAFPDRGVCVEMREVGVMRVTVERPIKCLVFEERDGYFLSDNGLDLVPGDEQVVTVEGFEEGDEPLSYTYLGQWEQ